MSTHRATQHVSVVPKDFDWHRVTPDLLTLIVALDGVLFGIMILLFLLLAEFPNIIAVALLAGVAWCLASIAYIVLKGRR